MRKDMMQAFELFQPDNLDAALSLADRYGDCLLYTSPSPRDS